jgi:LysR family hca operon transcriptional activator
MLAISSPYGEDMDLRRVRVFVAAASAGSFTGAGRRLGLSQSAVSQQIHLLEEEIGETLFVRSNRHARLSDSGERLFEAAQEFLRSWSTFVDRARPRGGEVAGRLVIGTSAAAAVHLWAEIFRAFGLRYPKVEMDIREMPTTQDAVDKVLSGDLDVSFSPLTKKTATLQHRVLGFQEALLCIAPSHPLAGEKSFLRSRFREERFILYEPGMSFRWLADDFFRRNRLSPTVVMESNNTPLIASLIEIGYGIGFLPNWGIQREIKEGRLLTIGIPGAPLRQVLGVIFHERRVSPAVHAFIRVCESERQLLPSAHS